jgi:hypothetical protein
VKAARSSLLGIACLAGLFSALLLGAPTAGADDGTGSTATDPTATDPLPPPGLRVAAVGVAVDGIDVTDLTAREIRAVVERRFARSFLLVISPSSSKRVAPSQLGARPLVGQTVEAALRAGVGESVRIRVAVDPGPLGRFVSKLARETFRMPVSSQLRLVRLEPRWSASVSGRRLKEQIAVARLRTALERGLRYPLPLPFELTVPEVSRSADQKVIVIRRESKQLRLYVGTTLKRVFRVATGLPSYPTPLGRWTIVNKQRHPWWYPPQGSAWAAGKQPVPPGPGNPLGTRWMGLSAAQVGIHGTPDPASIGYSASHGCIRMVISQAEWLFERVEVGTTVFIVPA